MIIPLSPRAAGGEGRVRGRRPRLRRAAAVPHSIGMRSRAARAVLGLAVLATAVGVGAQARASPERAGLLAAEDPTVPFAPEEAPAPEAVPPVAAPPAQTKPKTRWIRPWPIPRFLGGGLAYGKVSSPAPGVGTLDGRGWSIYFAWDLTRWLDLGFHAGASKTRVSWTPNPADTDSPGEIGFAGPGLVARLLPGRIVDPWIGVELAYQTVYWESYFHSVGGWGWLPSAGVDLQLVRFGVIRLGASYSSFTATTSSGYGQAGPTPGPEDDGQTAPMETLWLTAAWLFDFGPPR